MFYADTKCDVRCERVNVYFIYGILFRLCYYSIAEKNNEKKKTVRSVCSVENKLKIRNNKIILHLPPQKCAALT